MGKESAGADKGTVRGKKKPKTTKRKTHAELVDQAIQAFDKKLGTKNVTVGDFVRLLQIQKEIGGKEPKEIKVTWVEPGETKSSEK